MECLCSWKPLRSANHALKIVSCKRKISLWQSSQNLCGLIATSKSSHWYPRRLITWTTLVNISVWLDVAKMDTKSGQEQQSGNSSHACIAAWIVGVEWGSNAPWGCHCKGHWREPVLQPRWERPWPGHDRTRPGSEACVRASFRCLLQMQLLAKAKLGEGLFLSCLRSHIIPLPPLLCFGNSTDESARLPCCDDVIPPYQSNTSSSVLQKLPESRWCLDWIEFPSVAFKFSCASASVSMT